MALVRMNGPLENQQELSDIRQNKLKDVVIMDVDTNDANFQFSGDEGDIIDSGAIDHSSDSDYEPPITTFVIKTADKMTTGML